MEDAYLDMDEGTIKGLQELSADELSNFLMNEGFDEETTDMLKGEKVGGDMFTDLTDSDLKDIGIKLGPRKKIIKFIKTLLPTDPDETPKIVEGSTQTIRNMEVSPQSSRVEKNLFDIKAAVLADRRGREIIAGIQQKGYAFPKEREAVVRISVAKLIEMNKGDWYPKHSLKVRLAKDIVAAFPQLRSNMTSAAHGYEHFFDPLTETGFIESRLKAGRLNLALSQERNKKHNLDTPGSSKKKLFKFQHNTNGAALLDENELSEKTNSTDSLPYAVAEFIDENDALGIIACDWLIENDTACYYPSVRTEDIRDTLIEQRSSPSRDWNLHRVSVMRKYATFSEAKENLIKAEDTSSFNTDDGDNVVHFISEILQEKVDEDSVVNKRRRNSLKSSGSSHPSLISSLPTNSNVSPTFSNSNASSRNPTCSVPETTNGDDSISTQISNSTQPVDDIRVVLGQLQETVSNLHRRVSKLDDDLGQRLDQIVSLLTGGVQTEDSFSAELVGRLPLETMESFNAFDKSLKNPDVSKYVVFLFQSLGGKDMRTHLNNMLRRALTCELAMEFSFSGKTTAGTQHKEKKPFGKTNIFSCIKIAVRKMYPSSSETEIKVDTSKWLQQAKPRALRRAKGSQEDDAVREEN